MSLWKLIVNMRKNSNGNILPPKKAAGVAEMLDDETQAVHRLENFGC